VALALNAQKPGSVPIGLSGDQNAGLAGQFHSLSTNEDVLTINYHKWGQTFTSISGFYNYHYNSHEDFVALPVFYATQYFPEKYHQLSQEFRVASPTGGPIEYLAGVYLQSDQIVEDSGVTLPFADAVYGTFLPANDLPIVLPAPFSQSEHVYSVFGSLSWNATDRLKLTAGLRGSQIAKNINGQVLEGTSTQVYDSFVPYPPALTAFVRSALGVAGFGPQIQSRSDRAFMPSADIKYQLDQQAMVYFSYEKGFKAGGFNALNFFLPPDELRFGPEHVDAYELGIKSKWFDDTLLLNLDVFRSNYQDLQVNSNLFITVGGQQGLASFVRNAAESVSQGIEFEGQWAASKDWRLSADITYLDAHYVNYTSAGDTTLQSYCAATYVVPGCSQFPNPTPPFQDLSGRPTDYAPSISGSVTARYTAAMPGNLRFTTEVTPYFTSSYFLSGDLGATDDPLDRVPGYVRLDVTLTLEPVEGRWAFDLVGKNLTNRIIVTATQQGIYELSKEEPRNIALQFRYHW
jgi:outer membrane receptor protein involved in Fe transport